MRKKKHDQELAAGPVPLQPAVRRDDRRGARRLHRPLQRRHCKPSYNVMMKIVYIYNRCVSSYLNRLLQPLSFVSRYLLQLELS